MKKAKNKKALIILTLIAIAVIGGALYIKFSQTPPKTEQQKLQEEEKKAGTPDPKTDNEAYRRAQTTNTQTTAAAQGGKTKADIYISSISQSDGNTYINAIVNGQTSGTCTLTLTKSGATVTRTAPLAIVTSYYACQGFTVERAAFSSTGDWTATVTFTNNVSEGKTDPQTITIQ